MLRAAIRRGGPPCDRPIALPNARRPDIGFFGIVGLVAVVAIWLILTPLVPTVAATTMRRFHLRSDSFWQWAIQFPIPTMYNFANRYRVQDYPPDLADPLLADPLVTESEYRFLNHFPARIFTFADNRYYFLQDGRDHWLTIETNYRGQTIESTIHARAKADGVGFDYVRVNRSE